MEYIRSQVLCVHHDPYWVGQVYSSGFKGHLFVIRGQNDQTLSILAQEGMPDDLTLQ